VVELVAVAVEGDILGTVGIFLSGAGTLLTAFGAFHYERKRGEIECAKRFEAFREGMQMMKDEP
jgi:hypothetical protein